MAGVFEELWRRELAVFDEHKGLDLTWQSADGAMGKAPSEARRRGRTPPTEPKGGEALGPHGGLGGARGTC